VTITDDLVALVERDPHNPICEGMLYDHLYGDVGMTHSEAVARIATIVSTARTARRIRLATELLRGDGAQRWEVTALIHQLCMIPRGARPTIVIVDGDDARLTTSPDADSHESYWGHAVLAVGAAWLLAEWLRYTTAHPDWRGRSGLRYRRP